MYIWPTTTSDATSINYFDRRCNQTWQHQTKRRYKTLLPNQLNLYTACVKACRKNRGVVQFNLDGTPIKAAVDPTKVVLKPEKGYAFCAAQLK